jgi:hypothetical protein
LGVRRMCRSCSRRWARSRSKQHSLKGTGEKERRKGSTYCVQQQQQQQQHERATRVVAISSNNCW